MLSTAVCLAFLIPATAAGLSSLVYMIFGKLGQRHKVAARESFDFTILIPAHNEEKILEAALRSLGAQDYPRERVRVVVVADNCTDGTAAATVRHGAECVVRTDGTNIGKGYALAAGMEQLARRASTRSVVLVLDADCELSANALHELNLAFASGAQILQCAVVSRNADDGPAGYVAAVGAAFDNRIAAGRNRLGFRVPLRGTGMAFRQDVIDKVNWQTASPVEDAEYDSQLRAAGLRVRRCANAVVSCESPRTVEQLCRQRRRWALAGPMASKPIRLAIVFAASVLCVSLNQFAWWAAGVLLGTVLVYAKAMADVGFTWRRVGLLVSTPAVVLRLLGLAITGWLRPIPWERTPRLGEGPA